METRPGSDKIIEIVCISMSWTQNLLRTWLPQNGDFEIFGFGLHGGAYDIADRGCFH